MDLIQTIGTVLVALAGIAGTAWAAQLQTAGQRKRERLQDIRGVAARVLTAARDTETNLVAMNWTTLNYKPAERNAGRTYEEWFAAYDESNRQLRIAADELLLLEGGVQDELDRLVDGLSLGRAPDVVITAKGKGGQFETQRNALRDRLRQVLKE